MNLALFDFDGTVTTSDTWTPFMRVAIPPIRLLATQLLLTPVIAGYRLGMITGSRGRQVAVKVAFRGAAAGAVRDCGARYATTELPRTLRPSALDRIDWHQSRGDEVVIVSASLNVYLGPWCDERGLAYICTTLEECQGTLTGRCIGGDCSGHEKARRILARYEVSRYARVYAYGDSVEDLDMLALAHERYYRRTEIATLDDVTPDGDLRPRSHEAGG